MKLVFASNNAHKLQEVRQILPPQVQVISLNDVGFYHDIDEVGLTLEENSTIKAQTVWEWLVKANKSNHVDGVFADDIGLEIEALNGAPGVITARWAGPEANDQANRAKALLSLEGQANRKAQFRTVITLIGNAHNLQVEGIVRGEIALQEEGLGGFGYDPVFIPEGYNKTFTSLPAEVKNSISHRARAMEALRKCLES